MDAKSWSLRRAVLSRHDSLTCRRESRPDFVPVDASCENSAEQTPPCGRPTTQWQSVTFVNETLELERNSRTAHRAESGAPLFAIGVPTLARIARNASRATQLKRARQLTLVERSMKDESIKLHPPEIVPLWEAVSAGTAGTFTRYLLNAGRNL
jgi:hypothetical protein